ncbi:MAG: hypothetical protein GC154_04830 [bacterium]|nr:hypothetical protein [bacterium]
MNNASASHPDGIRTAPSPLRRRMILGLCGLVIFFSGCVVGGGLTVRFLWNRWTEAMQDQQNIVGRVSHRLERTLDLDATQTDRVREILQNRLSNLNEIRRRVKPDVQHELDGLFEDINAVLNPDQQIRWQRRFDLFENRMLPADWREPEASSTR